ncbi:hypothetical protein [Brevibacillus dissolubilis]|uniref:hypothetical protein n=1 Tax=Brevibacillus dissolubilis TaxID=1844116 RepID=UPI00111652CC|nr:hypothetical protein [Brevibacillus dissolubilis]
MNITEALKHHGIGVGKYKVGQYVPVENLGITVNRNRTFKRTFSTNESITGLAADSSGSIYLRTYSNSTGTHYFEKFTSDELGNIQVLFRITPQDIPPNVYSQGISLVYIDKDNVPYYRTPEKLIKADPVTGASVSSKAFSVSEIYQSEEKDRFFQYIYDTKTLYGYDLNLNQIGTWSIASTDIARRGVMIWGSSAYIMDQTHLVKYDLLSGARVWVTAMYNNLLEMAMDHEHILVFGESNDRRYGTMFCYSHDGKLLNSLKMGLDAIGNIFVKYGYLYYSLHPTTGENYLIKANKTTFETINKHFISQSTQTSENDFSNLIVEFEKYGFITRFKESGTQHVSRNPTHFPLVK